MLGTLFILFLFFFSSFNGTQGFFEDSVAFGLCGPAALEKAPRSGSQSHAASWAARALMNWPGVIDRMSSWKEEASCVITQPAKMMIFTFSCCSVSSQTASIPLSNTQTMNDTSGWVHFASPSYLKKQKDYSQTETKISAPLKKERYNWQHGSLVTHCSFFLLKHFHWRASYKRFSENGTVMMFSYTSVYFLLLDRYRHTVSDHC